MPDNLITNGGFEAGMQIWKGDGKIILLPDGNRVCEVEASRSRMKDIKQQFHMRQLQRVEIVFRARSVNYEGLGIRISVKSFGSGGVFWDKELPKDGSWRDYRATYTRTTGNTELRELFIATQLGSGKVQFDNVEVREPSKTGQDDSPATPLPPSATPAPPPPVPPVATTRQPALPPKPMPRPAVPAGTFGSLQQIMDSAPADAVQKLRDDATRDEAADQLDAYFAANVKGKPAQFRVTIDETRPDLAKPTEYLVHITDLPPTPLWNGTNLAAWLWVKFSEADPSAPAKLASRSTPTISGVITRCLVGRGGRFHLNVDLSQSKVEGP